MRWRAARGARRVPARAARDAAAEVAPLEVSQPDGVGFTLDGRLLGWQNWQLRLGFNYREGLVLHEVGFVDSGRLRPVAHRMSFAEMFVPYRDASPDHYRRTAFDVGESALGFVEHHVAGPRLRLPGRDRLPGRGGARLGRGATDDTQRDMRA